jgi:hypothetical protein
VPAHQLEQPSLHRGPDRRPLRRARRRADDLLVGAAGRRALVERGEVGHRHLDGDLDRLRDGWLDDLQRAGAGQERGHLVQRPHRGRQPDPLGGPAHRDGTGRRGRDGGRPGPTGTVRVGGPGEQLVEPLQGQREVRAALAVHHGVHLVEDHRLHPAQRLPGRRGEQQEQRLRGGDQHVGRGAGELAALVGRGVAGAHADRDVRHRQPEPLAGLADPGQRRAQVALHVHGQRLEG